jgi:hypothetical protein
MASINIELPGFSGQSGLTVTILSPAGRTVIESGIALTEGGSGSYSGTSVDPLSGTIYLFELRNSGGELLELFTYRANETGTSALTVARAEKSDGGYEFTGGFADRTTGTAGASVVGSNVDYTASMVAAKRWMRFGFDPTQQAINDSAYWSLPAPAPTAGVGLFGGSYMPAGVTSMFDYSFNSAGYSNALESGDLQYTAADGSYNFTECKAGDLALVRFDFNVLPQIANTTLEVGLIWQTRDENDAPTFTFALTGSAIFFGTGTVGKTFLQRPMISAYFASDEDVNARALPAIRADNPVQVQPLTTLSAIIR